jgi:hypothetical protein
MRYRIEFLREATLESSVCHKRSVHAVDLERVCLQAQVWSHDVRRQFGAGGFQVREHNARGEIVAIEAFDGPPPTVH